MNKPLATVDAARSERVNTFTDSDRDQISQFLEEETAGLAEYSHNPLYMLTW